jgi:hypothetical protein
LLLLVSYEVRSVSRPRFRWEVVESRGTLLLLLLLRSRSFRSVRSRRERSRFVAVVAKDDDSRLMVASVVGVVVVVPVVGRGARGYSFGRAATVSISIGRESLLLGWEEFLDQRNFAG